MHTNHYRVKLGVLDQMVEWEVLVPRDRLETLAKLDHPERLVDR